jgi:hypothetical protein
MDNEPLYNETLTSNLTTGLFIGLGIISGGLCTWRIMAIHFDGLAGVLCFFACFFAFYTVNYRKLVIKLSSDMLKLHFGVFHWRVPVENIASCRLDDQLNFIERYGGAGIHFMLVDGKYRANFNFLDHPRVAITFKRKVGLVQELSFSTQEPYTILDKIDKLIL